MQTFFISQCSIKSVINLILFKKIVNRIVVNVFIIIFFLISCKKDEDTNAPVISIFFPEEFSYYNIFDTVNIKAKIQDDNLVKSVDIVIVNINFQPVTENITYNFKLKEVDIETKISINDLTLYTGIFYVRIRANDGVNERNVYRAININGIPRKLDKIIIITQKQSLQYYIYSMDTVSQLINFYNGDFVSSAIDCNHSMLYVCGRVNSNLVAYNLNNNNIVWELPPDNNPPFSSFENLYFNNNILYVCRSNNKITGYNYLQNIMYNSSMPLGYIPKNCIKFNEFIITDEKYYSSNIRKIGVYYSTGSLMKNTSHQYDVKHFFVKDNDEIYLFANNENNKAVISIFNVDYSGFYSPYSLTDSTLKCALTVDNNNFLLAIANSIYRYQQSTNGLYLFLQGIDSKVMRFDDISQTLIFAEKNKLFYYQYPTGKKLGEYSFNENIIDIQLKYNKEKN